MDKTCSRKALMRRKGEGLSFLSSTAAPSHQPPPLTQLLEEMVHQGDFERDLEWAGEHEEGLTLIPGG